MIHVRCSKCDEVYPANQQHKCKAKPHAKPRSARFAKLSPPPEKLATSEKKLWNDRNAKIAKKPFPKIEGKPKTPFDRVAYQRDYMRKWRAADKAKKEQP